MDRQRRWPLHQINVITALIRQPFNLKGAWTERERERDRLRGREEDSKAGREEKEESLGCIQMCVPLTPTPPLISSSSLSLALMSSPAIVCPGLFKSNYPPGGMSWGLQGPALIAHSQSSSTWTPEGQTHRWTDLSFTLVPPVRVHRGANRNCGFCRFG